MKEVGKNFLTSIQKIVCIPAAWIEVHEMPKMLTVKRIKFSCFLEKLENVSDYGYAKALSNKKCEYIFFLKYETIKQFA